MSRPAESLTASSRATLRSTSRADQKAEIGIRYDLAVQAARAGIGQAMIADYVPLLMREALALSHRLV
jgi:hypothetical protein